MNKNGPIIIIEDDSEDQDVLNTIFDDLNYDNLIIFFKDPVEALQFLEDTEIEPFLVISDIDMPVLNGIELRDKLHNNEAMRYKTIPYLFFTSNAEQQHVIDAYSRSIQGFFIKTNDYFDIRDKIHVIVEYWKKCTSPNYIKNAQ